MVWGHMMTVLDNFAYCLVAFLILASSVKTSSLKKDEQCPTHQIYPQNLNTHGSVVVPSVMNGLLNPPLRDVNHASFSTASALYGKYMSQDGQDKFVEEVFKGKRNGFFVEAGAADGATLSNTMYLEHRYNWTGLLVEPHPMMFDLLRSSGLRQNSHTANCCLSLSGVPEEREFQMSGLLSRVKRDGDTSSQATCLSQQLDEIKVQCLPLFSLLFAICGNSCVVDYLSLDIEDGEVEVLKSLPLDRVVINLIGVEYAVDASAEKSTLRLARIRKLFEQLGGYSEVAVKNLDVFYMRDTLVHSSAYDR
eukprot:GHVQ01013907.1.p1 GENE.GHVQ01013907.1~~GHVQ01013907.1.p1  ORF type:complete len:307 (+),score=28.29 GHVQ01013907.1:271-1191(+)